MVEGPELFADEAKAGIGENALRRREEVGEAAARGVGLDAKRGENAMHSPPENPQSSIR